MKMKPLVRCSSLDRLLTCPGSATLERHLREQALDLGDESVDGDSMTWAGNWIHWWSAMRMVAEFGAIPPPGGLEKPVTPRGWTPNKWHLAKADWFLNESMLRTAENHAIYVERHFTADFEGFTLSGHIDRFSISPDGTEFAIDDLKTGENEVDQADENWQLAGYTVLLKRAFPTLQRGTIRIFQRSASTPVSEAEVTDLDTIVQALEARINEALANHDLLQTGYKQCRLCPCVLTCPCLHLEIRDMKLKLTSELLAKIPAVLPLAEAAEVAAEARAIKTPIDTLISNLKERVTREGPVQLKDGTIVQIVEQAGTRTVTHPKAAFGMLATKLDEDVIWQDAISVSLTGAEDALVAAGMQRKSKKGDVETADRFINEGMSHLIRRSTRQILKFK